MRRAGAALLLAAGLLAPLVSGQGPAAAPVWGQYGGDSHRSGVVPFSDVTLDVVRAFRIIPEGQQFGGYPNVGAVGTPHGVFVMGLELAPSSTVCRLYVVADPLVSDPRQVGPETLCESGGRVAAYDHLRDLVVVCIDGLSTDPILRAIDPVTGEVAWSRAPSVVVPEPGAADQNDWFCEGVAIDPATGIYYVPFGSDVGTHSIEAIDPASDTPLWTTYVPEGLVPALGPLAAPQPPRLAIMDVITLTDTGLVLTGKPGGATQTTPAAAVTTKMVAWFTLDGRFVSSAESSNVETPRGGSMAAAARGARAVAVVGSSVVYVDPASVTVESTAIDASLGRGFDMPAPVWSSETALIPLYSAALLQDATRGREPRIWPGADGALIQAAVIAPPSDAYVLVSRGTADGSEGILARVDLATARTVQLLALPSAAGSPLFPQSRLMATPDGTGLIVHDYTGDAVVVAPRHGEGGPGIEVSHRAPPVGEPVVVTVASMEGAAVTIAWGDGLVEAVPPGGRATHVFDEPGVRTIRVTTTDLDGHTFTSARQVHVDGPPELTAVQQAFSPENQETTYFVLGLVVTAVLAAFTFTARARGRGRLDRYLKELDGIREEGRADPFAALDALGSFGVRLRWELASGRIDDAKYAVVDQHARAAIEVTRQRALAPFAGRLSAAFHQRLDLALRDGRIERAESAELSAALRKERRLRPDERDRLLRLLQPADDAPR